MLPREAPVKLADLLTSDRIRIPLGGSDLAAALEGLLVALGEGAGLAVGQEEALAGDLATGAVGEVIRVDEQAVIVVCRIPEATDLVAALGVSPSPLTVTDLPDQDSGTARIVLLMVTPRRMSTLRAQAIPAVMRLLRETGRPEALLRAAAPADVRAMREVMDLDLNERLLVEDALAPVSYRVYPDTPMDEVLDLIVRRELRAVPVVGEKYEVLGMITAGEALKHLLHKRRTGEADHPHPLRAGEGVTARDVMSRSVLCVSEDQSLLEASNLMVNRNVEQLPVVREGELIGFLTRDQALQFLKD